MKIRSLNHLKFGSLALTLCATQLTHAADFTWDADTGLIGSQDGAGTWDNVNSNWISGAVNTPYVSSSANTATFGNAAGAAGAVSLASAQAAGRLTLNAPTSGNYSYSGSTLTLGTATANNTLLQVNRSATFNNTVNAAANNNQIVFSTAGQTLTFAGGGSVLGLSGGSLGISGSSAAIGLTSAINATSGAYTGLSLVNIGDGTAGTGGVHISGLGASGTSGGLQVGNERHGVLKVSDGATFTSTGQVNMGRGNIARTGRIIIENGTFTANASFANDTITLVGRNNGVGILDVTGGRYESIGNGIAGANGGVLGINADNTSNAAASGTLNISGGTVVVKDIRLHGANRHEQNLSSAGSATLNLSGGSLYVGGTVIDNFSHNSSGTGGVVGANVTTQGGIANRGVGTSTYAINLSGGTLGANADWSSDVDMSLVSGTTTIKAANEADAARNISLSGNLTGDGALNKSGGGSLVISGATTTYSGGTTVTGGTLATASTGSFGNGNVTITGPASLILGNTQSISDLATLMFTSDSSIQLGALESDIETVGSLWNSTTSETLAAGTYTASELNGEFGVSVFSGEGSLTVLAAIPEPSTAALMALGMVAIFRRRR